VLETVSSQLLNGILCRCKLICSMVQFDSEGFLLTFSLDDPSVSESGVLKVTTIIVSGSI
jgi:hypothetical protein